MGNTEILKEHWVMTKDSNENLIIQNKVQIELAMKVIELCDEKLKEFPEEQEIVN